MGERMTDFEEKYLEILDKFYNRIWWIVLWLFIIAMNSCDIKEAVEKIVE